MQWDANQLREDARMTTTMTSREAAQYMGVSYWKLLELAKAGRVPHVRLDGRVLFRRDALDVWMSTLEAASVAGPVQGLEAPGKIRKLK